MSKPITSLEELKNTIGLDLDLWTLVRFESGSTVIYPMLNPVFETGARGTKLRCSGGQPSADDYLSRWGIEDHDNHHTVYSYGHTQRWIFNSRKEAETYRKENFIR